MAIRELLHISKLNDLEKWLEKQGYIISETSKNPYEVLRTKKDKDTVIIYCKAGSKEHLSVMDKVYSLIRKFINDKKKQTNADRIRKDRQSSYDCGYEVGYNKAIDDFVEKVKNYHYILSDKINSTDYGMLIRSVEIITGKQNI